MFRLIKFAVIAFLVVIGVKMLPQWVTGITVPNIVQAILDGMDQLMDQIGNLN